MKHRLFAGFVLLLHAIAFVCVVAVSALFAGVPAGFAAVAALEPLGWSMLVCFGTYALVSLARWALFGVRS